MKTDTKLAFDKKVAFYNFFFGLLVIGGGLMGYYLKQSLPSLGAGLVFGNLLMLSVWGTGHLKRDSSPVITKIWGYYMATILAVVLMIFFITRIISTQNLIPGLPICVLASIAILLNVRVIHQNKMAANKS